MEKRAAAKSAEVLHQRIRRGVAARPPTARQQKVAKKMGRKEEKKVQRAADNEAYQAKRDAGREARKGGKRLGSRRTAAVEAQWGSQRGQYKE